MLGIWPIGIWHIQWLAKKLAVSISVIRKLAVGFIPVEIQKFY